MGALHGWQKMCGTTLCAGGVCTRVTPEAAAHVHLHTHTYHEHTVSDFRYASSILTRLAGTAVSRAHGLKVLGQPCPSPPNYPPPVSLLTCPTPGAGMAMD